MEVFLSLLNNIALLASLSIVHSLIMRRWRGRGIAYAAFSGLLFGIVAVVGMMNPLRLMPGIIFDGRSIIISIAGLFGGPVTAVSAALIAAAYRTYLGGAGAIMGVSVITESAAIGIAYHYLRRRYPGAARNHHLLFFGILVHLVMLILTRTLPGASSWEAFRKIALPVITMYPLGTLLVCRLFLDQESRLKAEDDLRMSEEKYRELVENAGSVIVRWTPEGIVTFINEYGLRLFGFAPEEVVGRHLIGTFVARTESSGRDLEAMIRDIPEHPDRYANNENENVCRDGRRLWMRWTNRPVKDNAGHMIECFSVGMDITEKRNAEQERLRLEEQLRQSQKMEAIGLLAGGVAHDLNNLLSPILGYGEMLLEEEGFSEEQRNELSEIVRAATRARDLVRQLMAFGRKQALAVAPLDLNTVIAGFSTLLRRTLREDIRIEYALAPSVRTVLADQGQIEQVVMNLAVNAQDAMPQGGILTIASADADIDEQNLGKSPDAQPGAYALLVLRDTGAGMDEDMQKRIFEPFFTTKEMGKGVGLGLATVYGIVRQHGGFIAVQSAPGQGTTFRVYLPAAEVAPETNRPVSDADPVGGNETILVAEDESAVRQLTCAMLERLGYRVLTAETPRKCFNLAQNHPGPIDLLLTDVIMPELSGKELYINLRRSRPEMKVLYMSGYTANVIAARGVLDQDTAFIQKPFTQPDIAKKIRQALTTP